MADIVFRCPLCKKSLSVDEEGAGLVVECPDCQGEIQIPQQGGREAPGHPRLVTGLLVAVGILTVWAGAASLVASRRGTSAVRLRQELASVMANIDALKEEAETIREQADQELAEAKREAYRLTQEAKAIKEETQGFLLREQQELQRMYPGLTKFHRGRNEIKQRYLEAFEVDSNRIKTFMRNRSNEHVRPNFTLLFLTKYGFVTESFNKSWLLDSMKPGESRIDDDSGIHWRFEEPTYYTLEFQN